MESGTSKGQQKGSDLDDKYFGWTPGEKNKKTGKQGVKRHLTSSEAYIRRQRISKATKLDAELVRLLRKDIEKEVQGGSVNMKFEQMRRMMGASKLIGVFQSRFYSWKLKGLFRWKFGDVDLLVKEISRTTSKLEKAETDGKQLKKVMNNLEHELEDLTGSATVKQMKRRKSITEIMKMSERSIEERQAAVVALLTKIKTAIDKAEEVKIAAAQAVQAVEGQTANEFRNSKLKSVLLATRKRLFWLGFSQWNQGVNDMILLERGENIAVSHNRKKLKAYGFKKWSSSFRRIKLVNALYETKIKARKKELLREWAHFLRSRKHARSLFESIFEKTRLHIMKDTVFGPWKKGVALAVKLEEMSDLKDELKKYKLQVMCVSLKRHMRACRKIAFSRWLESAREAARLQRKLAKAGLKLLNRSLARAVGQWKDLVVRRTTQRKRMIRIAGRLAISRMKYGWRQWEKALLLLLNEELEAAGKNDFLRQRALTVLKIVRKKEKHTQSLGFRAWQEWWIEDKRVMKALLRAAMRMKNRKVVEKWNAWLEFIDHRQYKRRHMRNILVRLSNVYYAKGFYTWRKQIRDNDMHFHFMQKMFSRMINTKMLSGWQTWVDMVEAQKEHQNNLRKALMSWTKKSLSNCFKTWADTAIGQKREAVLLARCGARIMKRTVTAAFFSWNDFVDWRQGAGKLLFRIMQRLRQDHLKLWAYGLSTWKLHIEKDRVKRDHANYIARMKTLQLTKLIRKKIKIESQVAFGYWREMNDTINRHNLVIGRIIKRRHWSLMGQVFDGWVMVHTELVRVNTLLRRTLAKIQKKTLTRTFDFWVEGAQEQIRIRIMLRRFGRKMKQRELVGAFNRWEEYRQERLYAKALGWKVLSRLGKTQLFGGFTTWVKFTKAGKDAMDHQRALMKRVLGRLLNTKTGSAMSVWIEMVETEKRNEVIMARVAKKMKHRVLNGSFLGWAENVAEVIENRIKVKRALMRMKMRVVAQMFGTWIDMVDERIRLRGIVSKTVHRLLNGKLSAAFQTWQRFADGAKHSQTVAANAAMKMLNPALFNALNKWKDMVETNKFHRTAIRKAAMKWSRRTLSNCFFAIANLCGEEKVLRTKLGRAMGKLLNKRRSLAMEAWLSYTAKSKRLGYMSKRALSIARVRLLRQSMQQWQKKAALYMKRHRYFYRIACKTRKKLVVKGLTQWKYALLGIRMGSTITAEKKKHLPEAMKRDSVTESGLARYFLESGWDHNFVAEKLPVYNPVGDKHCTFAHTPEYKTRHEQILALEEQDRKMNKVQFPGQKFAPSTKSRLKDLQSPAKGDTDTAASGSPSNAVKSLRGTPGGKKSGGQIEVGEDVVEYLTLALSNAEAASEELRQSNQRMIAEFKLKEQMLEQKMNRKAIQCDEIIRLQNQEVEDLQKKYDDSVIESKVAERELIDEIRMLNAQLREAEEKEENILKEKSDAKLKESKLRHELILTKEKVREFEEEEIKREEVAKDPNADSVETLRRKLDEAIEDMHSQNEVIQLMSNRMNEEERLRLEAERALEKTKANFAKEMEEKLGDAKEEFMELRKHMASMNKKLYTSRSNISSLDQKGQLSEKKWEEENRKLVLQRVKLEHELTRMSRAHRLSEMHKNELASRLALFEGDRPHGHHHHHHHHHHHKADPAVKNSRPATAGPKRNVGDNVGPNRRSASERRPQTAGAVRTTRKGRDPVVKKLNW
eukprot:Stramenopile-MAST_4_protein_1386